MAYFSFFGLTSTGLPLYGARYTASGFGTSAGQGWTYTDTGDFGTASNFEEAGQPFDPVVQAYAPSAPGPGDDVTITGQPAGTLTPYEAPSTPIVEGGQTVGTMSGYVSVDGADSSFDEVGYSGGAGFAVTGVTGTIDSLTVDGPGTITLGSLAATAAATFDSYGPAIGFPIGFEGVDASSPFFAPSNQTVTGGSLSTAVLTLSAATYTIYQLGPTPIAIDPVADASTLTIDGAALSGDVTQIITPSETGMATVTLAPVTLTDNATLTAKTQLDIVGIDPVANPNATGTQTLAATGSMINAGSVIVATGAAGYGSASTTAAALTLAEGSTLTVATSGVPATFLIGDTGLGMFGASGGSTISDGTAVIANATGSTGTATLDGGSWTNAGYLAVGNSGLGTLTIEDGAALSDNGPNGNGFIGGLEGSDGSAATITGNGTNWQLSGYLLVGSGGDGMLTVADQAQVTTKDILEAGVADGVTGIVDVSGGATVTTDTAGGAGTSSTIIGDGAGAEGELDIEGAGSMLESKGATSIGYSGDGTATVGDGGTLLEDAATIRVGRNEGGTGELDVTGQDSNLTGRDATLYAGYGGTGDVTIAAAGALLVKAADIGGEAGGVGTVTLDGMDTTGALGILTVGDAGEGSLDITGGAQGTTKGALVVGAQEGGSGTLMLDGQDSTLTTSGDGATIGEDGNADVTIGQGATLDASLDDVTIAEGGGSVALVSLTGDTASGMAGELDAASLTVGGSGDGTLDAGSGSTVMVDDDMTIGEGDGGTGEVTVTGQDTGLSVGGDLVVGGDGTGTLTIGGPGANASVSGDTTVGEGGTGTLAVQGGEFDATGKLVVGGGGNGIVFVQLGGTLAASAGLTLGESDGGVGELDVNGAMSQVMVTGDFVIGSAGRGDAKITQAGGVQVTGDVTVADTLAANAQALTLDTGGQLTLTGDLVVGGSGAGGADVLGGSQLEVGGAATVGDMGGASGIVTVDGRDPTGKTPSTFTFGSLTVGKDGTGSLAISDGALAGGPVSGAAGPVTVEIGADANGVGTVTLSGAGSTLKADVLDVGSAAGGAGTLTIGAGATVAAADVTVFQSGTLTLAGGTLLTDPLTLTPGSIVEATGEITGDLLGTGTIVIGAGGTLDLTGAVAAGITLAFDPAGTEDLELGSPGSDRGTVGGFLAGDTIMLGQFSAIESTFVAGDLVVRSGLELVADLRFAGDYADGSVFAVLDGGVAMVETNVACYAAGTRIMTRDGEVTVEALAIGDRVVTAAGGLEPVRWIGRRSYAGRFLRANPASYPILLRAGSLGAGLPFRDLRVSPKHAMFIDGVLVPAESLVNGYSIVRDRACDRVDYFHIELDHHDVLLAEGAPSESFVDDEGRGLFHNAAEWRAPHDGAARKPAVYCARRATDGFELEAIRQRLAA